MEETEVSNLSIAAAIGQLEQADAAARITGSALFPLISASNNGQSKQRLRRSIVLRFDE